MARLTRGGKREPAVLPAPGRSAPAPRIAVVDYGAGNLVSIEQALSAVGARVAIARDPHALADADGVVVPGVGAAAPAMARLAHQGLVAALREWIDADRPYLGICLGLQLLFEASDEDGASMLGVLPGRAVRLVGAPTLPHIGWNQVRQRREHRLFDGIPDGADLYFVHSYAGALAPEAEDAILADTEHGGRFVSAVARGPLLGVQFHPERSGRDGLRLLANFARIVADLAGIGPARATVPGTSRPRSPTVPSPTGATSAVRGLG